MADLTPKLRLWAETAINGRGRSTAHITIGALLVTGAVTASAVIAAHNAPTPSHPRIRHDYEQLKEPSFQPPAKAFSVVWPPLFVLLTLSGLRVWNAPSSRERTKALGLWGAVQGLNALWMALGPRRLPLQVATAVTTLSLSAAYARHAGRVDRPAAQMVAPYLGWIAFANLLTGELLRLNRDRFEHGHAIAHEFH